MLEQKAAALLQPVAIRGIKPCQFRTIEIQHAEHLSVLEQWHHKLGTRCNIARNMPGELVHVRNDEGFSALRGRAADTAAERDPHAGNLSLKRSEDQLATLDEVKPNPI